MLKMDPKQFITDCLLSTKRAGMKDLLEWMEANGFFNAPASSKYHLSRPFGLAIHSIHVWYAATDLLGCNFIGGGMATDDFIDSITICALLHDIGKVGQFGKPQYRFVNETIVNDLPQLRLAPQYETNKDLLYIPHEIRSVIIASKFIDLTEEEQYAILYHNGLYGELKGFKNKETPLLLILQMADLWACKVMEEEE